MRDTIEATVAFLVAYFICCLAAVGYTSVAHISMNFWVGGLIAFVALGSLVSAYSAEPGSDEVVLVLCILIFSPLVLAQIADYVRLSLAVVLEEAKYWPSIACLVKILIEVADEVIGKRFYAGFIRGFKGG